MKKIEVSIQKRIKDFRAIGLTQKEATIYSVLLDSGGGYPSAIANKAGLNRSTSYSILTDLAIKGLVTEIKRRNKLYYQIEPARKLVRFAKEKISIAENRLIKAKKIAPDIEALFSLIPNKPVVKFFSGPQEILAIHEDHINTNKKYEMLAWANTTEIAKFLPEKMTRRYLKKKELLGIKTRAIAPDTQSDRNYSKKVYRGIAKKILPNLKFVSSDEFPYPCEITIYRNKRVSILNFSKNTPAGVIIEDATIHGMMKMIFELSWKSAIK
jgi:HTH-type transcriptional regulator, sugar sensing transcriptional regulator